MSNVLDKIVVKKLEEIAAHKAGESLEAMQRKAAKAEDALDFFGAIQRSEAIALIAEVKKASPSKGIIREDFDPVAIAKIYQSHGATCISVLTDEPFFQGSLDYLAAIRAEVSLPLLRKDFILDPYQVYQARAYGADAVLLIAECLEAERLNELHNLICELGMTPLVEYYEPENLDKVVACGAKLIGVNNRNLKNFETDLHHTVRQRQRIPADRLLVGESGIYTRADAVLLQDNGAKAMLVGESLMRQEDIGTAVDQLLGR